jgi:enoyl-CoA hydratase
MSELQYLEVERRDAVALVRLNRPEVLNALCMGLMQEMAEQFAELEG